MGKRSNFKRNPRDYYKTPYKCVLPLLPHITVKKFIEPCAGDGALVQHLEHNGLECVKMFDIEPQDTAIEKGDALKYNPMDDNFFFFNYITNPPWSRDILHPMIERFIKYSPAWLLIDADWMQTVQAAPYLENCEKIVSIGRVSWMENGTQGKDNCAWYYFTPRKTPYTEFYGREKARIKTKL